MTNLFKNINHSLTAFVFTLALGVFSFTAMSCGGSTSHPGQLNSFDGATYDTLTVTHTFLENVRSTVANSYPQYKPQFDTAASAYNASESLYAGYRVDTALGSASVTASIAALTPGVVALVQLLQSELHPTPAQLEAAQSAVQAKTKHAPRAVTSNVSVQTILSYLEIAAGIAEAVPGISPYASLAALVLGWVQNAEAALTTSVGTPIDLTTIGAIQLL